MTGQRDTSVYAAVKGGELAIALSRDGIRVHAILPAKVMTPLYQAWLRGFDDPEGRLRVIANHVSPGHRLTTQEEIADTALFMLSLRSGHTTGQWLHVDGDYARLDRAIDAEGGAT